MNVLLSSVLTGQLETISRVVAKPEPLYVSQIVNFGAPTPTTLHQSGKVWHVCESEHCLALRCIV